ncbi:MAG: Mrp/NBP35 family ATP-binding protein [Crenarchaeota archaeon]|nr:Mrp/NBP35 family ATP-binding protein [Thermoproteota archaeon]
MTTQQGQTQKTQPKLGKIKHKIAIISGKGGVGKNTVTSNLAMAFMSEGQSVSLMQTFMGHAFQR